MSKVFGWVLNACNMRAPMDEEEEEEANCFMSCGGRVNGETKQRKPDFLMLDLLE